MQNKHNAQAPLILASASPRRRELIAHLNRPYTCTVSNIEEIITKTAPAEVVCELSRQKAEDVAQKAEAGSIVIGADTVVACDGRILGKPKSDKEAKEMLHLLSGRTHSVFTGVTLCQKKEDKIKTESFAEETKVTFYPMTEAEIDAYIVSGDCYDKAGAYGIQSGAAIYVRSIEGDYNNVVGLPVAALYHHLCTFETENN